MITRHKLMKKLFPSSILEGEQSDKPLKIGYRQLRLIHSLFVYENKIRPIQSKELDTMIKMVDEYTLEMDLDYDLNLSVMTDELSTYNTTSVGGTNSQFNATSDENSSKLSISDSEGEDLSIETRQEEG